ncbi:MAG: SMC family ATPase [Candidatus Daviesbacteria bacterium]|nr:SMC family ATPase [Candidatus Daviesbacteria bacterium]
MIPVKLKLSNFTSYGQNPPELDFTKFKLAAISGLNGAGKSSLLDGVTWCIWGTSRAGDSSDSLIHSGADNMYAEFEFELNGHNFIIKRSRSKKGGGTTNLEFWSGSHNLTEGTIKTTQEKIITTLHLNFETFSNSSYLRQGHADEFTTKGPTERKKILADILGLDHYDLLEEKAKEKSKAALTKLQLLDYQLLEIEAELSQKEERSEKKKAAENKINEVETQIKASEEKIKALREKREALSLAFEQRNKLEQNYLENKKELEEIITQGKNRKSKIESLKLQFQKLQGVSGQLQNLKSLQQEKEKMDKTRQEQLEIKNKLSVINGEINVKKQQTQSIQKEIDKLTAQLSASSKTGAKCPTCGQEIGKAEKSHVRSQLTTQITNLKKDLQGINFSKEEQGAADLENQLKAVYFDPEKYQQILLQLKDSEEIQKQNDEKLTIQATLQTEEKVVLEMRVLFQNKKLQVDKISEELTKLPDLSEKIINLNQEITDTENQLTGIREEEKEARGILGQINELISRTAQMENLSKQKTTEKSTLTEEKETFEELALAFGKKGIQAMIIEAAIPEIEDETNSLLEKLTEGRMKVSFQTQKETKTKLAGGEKGIIETLDIIISDEMGERPYEMYSGGEAFRVNFCIRLAISKLLTHRAGAKLQFLVIDEGFGSQDAPGRARLVEAIDTIKNDFEKIVVITHIEELKEEFPVRIEVQKGPTGSTFKVVGI